MADTKIPKGLKENSMYKVLKPFHTFNRRFSTGAEVGPNDIQGATSFDVWVQLGFIAGPKTKPVIAVQGTAAKREKHTGAADREGH